jgi:hypothetical protein
MPDSAVEVYVDPSVCERQEVGLGRKEGLSHTSVVNLDNVHVVAKSIVGERIGRISSGRQREVKRALGYALDWEELKVVLTYSSIAVASRRNRIQVFWSSVGSPTAAPVTSWERLPTRKRSSDHGTRTEGWVAGCLHQALPG